MYSWPYIKLFRQDKKVKCIKLDKNYKLSPLYNNKCPICCRNHRKGILTHECRKALIPLDRFGVHFAISMEIGLKIRIREIMKTASEFLLGNIGTVWWCVHKYIPALICPVIILNPYIFLLNNMKEKSLEDQVPIECIGFPTEKYRLEYISNLKRLNFQSEEISKELIKSTDKLNSFRTAIVYIIYIYILF